MTQIHITLNIPCPCKECVDDRSETCHSTCTKGYKEYRARLDKHLKEQYKRNVKRDNAFSAALLKAVDKCIK